MYKGVLNPKTLTITALKLCTCYELNVSHKILCWILNHQGDSIWLWPLGGNQGFRYRAGPSWWDLCPDETSENLLLLSLVHKEKVLWVCREKVAVYKSGREPSPQSNQADTLALTTPLLCCRGNCGRIGRRVGRVLKNLQYHQGGLYASKMFWYALIFLITYYSESCQPESVHGVSYFLPLHNVPFALFGGNYSLFSSSLTNELL